MVATRTQQALIQPITQTALVDACKPKFSEIGYTLLDDYISGTDRFLVYSYQFDATKTQGTVFFRFKFTTALAVTQQIGTAYNAATKVLSNPGTESFGNTFLSNTNLDLITYSNGNQYRLIFLGQGTGTIYTLLLGFIRPDNQPEWWNENLSPYCLVSRNTDPHFGTLYPTGLLPFAGANSYTSLPIGALLNANPLNSKRDILNKIPITITGNNGIAGFLPDDICAFAGNGASKLDTLIISPTEKYEVLYPLGSSSSGYAMRIV